MNNHILRITGSAELPSALNLNSEYKGEFTAGCNSVKQIRNLKKLKQFCLKDLYGSKFMIIKPGTEPQIKHNEANAIKVAEYIAEDLKLDITQWKRNPKDDSGDGWYGFIFKGAGGKVRVNIPGIDPDVVRKSKPFESPHLYVNGSRWLYGYALNFIFNGI